LTEKDAGKEWSSPARRLEAEGAQDGGFMRRVAAALCDGFCASREEQREENGEGEKA